MIAISTDNSRRTYGIDDELLLGVAYGAGDVVPVGGHRASGAVGRRVPHVALADGASTLDVLPRDFAIVTAQPDPWWLSRGHGDVALDGVPVIALTEDIRGEAVPGSIARLIGLADGHALLVRPDGHIAARASGHSSDAARAISDGLRRASGRG
ncbi:hypothetical protein [Streptomyces sp. AC495_CC817]|uniref:aromatic-ring hydroxylase C-terminal domain-containing protein n=1 Tax=Streptomyces sp. AC495_CC817 TaxID=2823900 RepID=UPI0035A949B3